MKQTKEFYELLFPLKGELTGEILENTKATRHNPWECAGVKTLIAALGENAPPIKNDDYSNDQDYVAWFSEDGRIYVDGSYIGVTTEEDIDFVKAIYPTSVTFILQKYKTYKEEF